MKIKLPDFDLSAFPKVYVGDQSRYATATTCAYISEDRLLSAQFLNRKIYLHDVKDNFKIIDEKSICYFPDLMDHMDGVFITSNYPTLGVSDGTVSVFNLKDDKIELVKHISLGKAKTHGCRLLDTNHAYVTDTANNKGIVVLELDTGKILERFNDFSLYPKDVHLTDDYTVMITSDSRPSRSPVEITYSKVYLYGRRFTKLKSQVEFNGQTDAVTLHDDDIFVTLQGQHFVAHFKIDRKEGREELKYVGNISGYSFPHGISSHKGMLCVTNYGDNTIEANKIEDLIASDRYKSRI